jgi:sec-independent protein translocase protein TatA
MGFSIPHLLLVLIVIFVVFGAGKLPKVMGDIGRGIKSLREGLKGEDEAAHPEHTASTTNGENKPL